MATKTPPVALWQWPNILGLDAAAIAMAWLWMLAESSGQKLHIASYLVLGLSVWLIYLADRWLDARKCPPEQLLSARHRFSKTYSVPIAVGWCLLLLINIGLALRHLEPWCFHRGLILLAVAASYTYLNQMWSRRFFPKEIAVALIFTAGPQVFLPLPTPWNTLGAWFMLCLLNCLLIAYRERAIDAKMCTRSIATKISHPYILWAIGLGTGILATASPLGWLIGLPLLGSLILQIGASVIPIELFRVLCDELLLLAPICYWLLVSG